VPSFALALERKVVVPEYGSVTADVAFGGQFYVMARAADVGVALGPEHAPAIARAAMALLAAARVGDHQAVVPSIQGRAWITGHVQHVVAPDDPFPMGLTVGDIWSPVPD
jgi:proline racemase